MIERKHLWFTLQASVLKHKAALAKDSTSTEDENGAVGEGRQEEWPDIHMHEVGDIRRTNS